MRHVGNLAETQPWHCADGGSVVEFGDTLIREVMPPRPDIGAVKSSATLLELTDLFCEQLCVGEVNVEILEAERRRIQPVRMHRRLVIKEEPSDA